MVNMAYDAQQDVHSDKAPHVPVMLREVQEYLPLKPDACFVDCTAGLGGHARALAQTLGPEGRLIALDRDSDSVHLAERNLQDVRARCDFIHSNFRDVDRILDELKIEGVDGFLFDLGISSYQLDNPERGFSLNAEGPLDMRMDQQGAFSAYDLINSLSEKEIDSILKLYGEERLHRRIAHFLIEERRRHPIESTQDLKDVVLRALPQRYRRQKIHPATRTFQAFRIAVNRELESLDLALEKAVPFLRAGGRIAVIAFHSLEDRISKQTFRAFAKEGTLQILTKKPLRPGDSEIAENPRARSARLRVAEKL